MDYTLIISSDADNHSPARRALGFARALANRPEHSLKQVFFYAEGVRSALQLVHQQDWLAVVSDDAELVLCSASADRMGVNEAPEGFIIAGLGALIESGVGSERVISFV